MESAACPNVNLHIGSTDLVVEEEAGAVNRVLKYVVESPGSVNIALSTSGDRPATAPQLQETKRCPYVYRGLSWLRRNDINRGCRVNNAKF